MWRMSLWTLTSQSLKNPAHVRRVVVVLLTGQKLEALVDPSTTAQQMFESIITHIELPEFFFFGLTHINGDLSIYYWLIYNELIIVFPIRKKNLKSCKWSLEYDQSLNLYMWTWRLKGASFFFFIKVCQVFAGGVVCGSNFYIETLEQTFAQSTLE